MTGASRSAGRHASRDVTGTPCTWAGCGGALEADGYCDTCGRTAPPSAAPPPHRRSSTAPPAGSSAGPRPSVPQQRPAPPGSSAPRSAPPRSGAPAFVPSQPGPPPSGPPGHAPSGYPRRSGPPRSGPAPTAPPAHRPPSFGASAPPPPGTLPSAAGPPAAAGSPCRWSGCDGALEADGYCDSCGRPAPATSAAAAPAAPAPAAPQTAPGPAAPGGTAARSSSARWSGPLSTGPTGSRSLRGGTDADIPPVPRIDPLSALLADPQVPEPDRFCRHGGTPHPVGRSRNGRPGQLRGYCPQDGTPYSFAPPLAAGTLVAGQYEVEGALAHGGLGWIYLAVDRNVDDRWVVLKGVLNADDPAALAAARAERQFLAQLNHPGIVAIHNFVRHVDVDGVESDYIVMAYIGGSTLAQVWRTPTTDPAQRVAHALTSMIKILPALGYLHAEGHVYCDLKPDNVMQCEQRLTLIDMGAVARIDDADAVVYGTVGYHAPEVVRGELSSASDLYTVGRTLAVLALDMEPVRGRDASALPEDHPMLLRHESLHRLLLRATHPEPRCRFGSAEEMVEQLEGVRREVLAVKDGRPRPAVSPVFSPPSDTFAAGLLAGPDGPGRPDPATVADLLAQPLVEADDPVTDALAAVAAGRPVPPGCAADWRLDWLRATRALAAGDLETARSGFDALYTTFPGELAPPLALGAIAECAGYDDVAQRYYQQVSTVDPSWADAAFGLARTLLRAGSRAGAVAALHAVPSGSRAYVAAQLAAVEATLAARATGAGGQVEEAELRAAAERVERLTLDPITTLRMRVAVLDAAIEQVPRSPHPLAPPVLGCEWKERPLRLALERSLRDLARLTPDGAERVALVDRANDAHPRTLR
jgi:serine/threonine-protein kinase PknG